MKEVSSSGGDLVVAEGQKMAGWRAAEEMASLTEAVSDEVLLEEAALSGGDVVVAEGWKTAGGQAVAA